MAQSKLVLEDIDKLAMPLIGTFTRDSLNEPLSDEELAKRVSLAYKLAELMLITRMDYIQAPSANTEQKNPA